jgi:hypothetical protein
MLQLFIGIPIAFSAGAILGVLVMGLCRMSGAASADDEIMRLRALLFERQGRVSNPNGMAQKAQSNHAT